MPVQLSHILHVQVPKLCWEESPKPTGAVLQDKHGSSLSTADASRNKKWGGRPAHNAVAKTVECARLELWRGRASMLIPDTGVDLLSSLLGECHNEYAAGRHLCRRQIAMLRLPISNLELDQGATAHPLFHQHPCTGNRCGGLAGASSCICKQVRPPPGSYVPEVKPRLLALET